MSDSDSDCSSSTNSSSNDSSDTDEKPEVDMEAIRLAQMRRTAEKRGGMDKLLSRLQILQSHDDMLREHALKRMQDGVYKILSFHSAYELSSICGTLGLKTQMKADQSVKQIIDYCSEGNKLVEERLYGLLRVFWEGALFEYLRSIGHPMTTCFVDPKQTVLQIWREGGIISIGEGFTPHFIAREVKKRYEWVQSSDITNRLNDLRARQENVKKAERKVISDHDYTNIIDYFRQVNELRSLEGDTRNFLIGELEVTRTRIDSQQSVARMHVEQMVECEQQFIRCVEHLNERLAHHEYLCQKLTEEKLSMESQLSRLISILDKNLKYEENRQEVGGGSQEPWSLYEVDDCHPLIQEIHEKILQSKESRDSFDNRLRSRCESHVEEIERLQKYVRNLEAQVDKEYIRANLAEKRADHAEKEVKFAAWKLLRLTLFGKVKTEESWACALRYACKYEEQERKKKLAEPVLLSGLIHSSPLIQKMSSTLLSTLDIGGPDRIRETYEKMRMFREDESSQKYRLWDIQQQKKKAAKKAATGANSPTSKASKGKTKKSTKTADEASVITMDTNESNMSGKIKKSKANSTEIGEKESKEGGKSAKKNGSRPGTSNSKSGSRPSTSDSQSRPNTSTKKKKK